MNTGEKAPTLYLKAVIGRHAEELGSFNRLAEAVAEANEGTGRRMDRRKLKAIADGLAVTFSTDELAALDTYLSPSGEGLGDKPLFEKERLLNELAEGRPVWFLFGTHERDEPHISVISQWDVKSMAEILRALYRLKAAVQFDVYEFLLPTGTANYKIEEKKLQEILKNKDDAPSLCSIGSPRASMASELMLAGMFDVKPFCLSSRVLPFYFVWPEHSLLPKRTSAFAWRPAQFKQLKAEEQDRINRHEAMALKITGEDLYIGRAKGEKTGKEYGVVVAQRRSNGTVWMVVAGLSGPITYAAAKAVCLQLEGKLPAASGGKHSDPVWSVITSDIEVINALPGGDNRRVNKVFVLRGLRHWRAAETA